MSEKHLTKVADYEYFTLGDLEDLIAKARQTLSRDCVVHFPMDSAKFSDSHGHVESIKLTYGDVFNEEDGTENIFFDIDFS